MKGGQEVTQRRSEEINMGEKGKKAAKAAGVAAKIERMKKVCSNCGEAGGSDEKNFSKCASCELTRHCSRDC